MSTSKRINRTDGEWEELIKEFNASGLTQGVFCEQRGVANRFNGDTDILTAPIPIYGRGSSCCIPEVHRNQGNGKLPPDTFRLVGPNIRKDLTARIRSETEVQKIILNFRH